MRIFIMLLLSMMISACTTDNAIGVKANVFEKTNHYAVTFKKTSSQDAVTSLLTQLLPSINSNQSNSFTIQYRTEKARNIARQLKVKLAQNGVAPSDIHLTPNSVLKGDIDITQHQYVIQIPPCPPEMIGRPTIIAGCYVDSLRLQQISHPEHLYQPSK
ncbi:hypothetical protein [Photobacterium leiognathi]|uniref:hypothetical protein n=1 Tax=Photobacterium leiognathi TaxID=553611 RepID=UPI0029814FD5|nr:hypothetical protein [Photobacterium leiognathi]